MLGSVRPVVSSPLPNFCLPAMSMLYKQFVILPFVFSPTAAPAYRETVLLIVPLLEPQIPPDFPSEDTLPEKKQSVIAPEF